MINPDDILNSSILIVDDQAANVTLLEQMLSGAGYTCVSSTRDPQAVCELHRRNRYDLILLDLRMPGLDGFEVMERLKEIEAGSYLPVLVITAQPESKLRALKAGAKDFVSKPFDVTEVLLRVHNLLEVRLLYLKLTVVNFTRLENSQRIAGLGDWEHTFADDRLVWSAGVYRILGLPPLHFPASLATFEGRVHPEDLALVHRPKPGTGDLPGRVDTEYRIIRPGGEVRYVHQISELVLDDQGRPIRESGTMQDVTDRHLAERSLRQSEERYRLLFELNPSPMWIFDHATFGFLAVNNAAVALLGYSREEFLQMKVGAIRPLDVAPDFLETIAPRPFRSAGRYSYRRKDGTGVVLDIYAHGITFADRAARFVLAIEVFDLEREVPVPGEAGGHILSTL